MMFTMSKTQPSWAHFSLKFPIMIRLKLNLINTKIYCSSSSWARTSWTNQAQHRAKLVGCTVCSTKRLGFYFFFFWTELGFKSSTYIRNILILGFCSV